jgi:flagellar biosynthesis/type III secretory pathway chaperone
VECKAEIQARFFKSIANVANSTAARNAFPELTQVWQAILKVVERSMSEARRNEVLDTFE